MPPANDRLERVREPFLAAVRAGASMAEASRVVGVADRTMQNWVKRGGRESGTDFASFAAAVTAAREEIVSGPMDLAELREVVARAARKGSVQAMKLALELARMDVAEAVKPVDALSRLDELAAARQRRTVS
jgi:transposase-like protein